ncbi:MAG TPA: hypothetical protein VIW03_19225 [Anaeromyxobacter sp.]
MVIRLDCRRARRIRLLELALSFWLSLAIGASLFAAVSVLHGEAAAAVGLPGEGR